MDLLEERPRTLPVLPELAVLALLDGSLRQPRQTLHLPTESLTMQQSFGKRAGTQHQMNK